MFPSDFFIPAQTKSLKIAHFLDNKMIVNIEIKLNSLSFFKVKTFKFEGKTLLLMCCLICTLKYG